MDLWRLMSPFLYALSPNAICNYDYNRELWTKCQG
jgi:hypothetical protein